MSENLLIVADSDRDPDMLYAVRMFVPDPFIYLRVRDRSIVVLPDMEFARGKREATHCKVFANSEFIRLLKKQGVDHPTMADMVRAVLKEFGVRKVTVPERFPLGLAKDLQRVGLKVKPVRGELFPERAVKSLDEVKKISAALAMAEVGLAEAIHALKHARIGKGRRLIYRNAPLTSERLRAIIDTAVLQAGGLPAHTIVAGGSQGFDPHERGSGYLKAGEPIILDVFPRSQKTGYFGDITRTVVKGRASDSLREMYRAVSEAQDVAFAMMRDGVPTRSVHDNVCASFEASGFTTQRKRGKSPGFIHGTGHGLGLEIHERLGMGLHSDGRLRCGNVLTIEPGLYDPRLGGVRLEDVVLVNRHGSRNLTRFEKVFEV